MRRQFISGAGRGERDEGGGGEVGGRLPEVEGRVLGSPGGSVSAGCISWRGIRRRADSCVITGLPGERHAWREGEG